MRSFPLALLFRLRGLSAAAVALGLLAASNPARAQPSASSAPAAATAPHPHAYGILIGTNVGGAGQEPLRYAEEDAQRVAQVLRELGRFGTTDLRVLVRPDTAKVFATIDDVAAKLRAHEQRGEQAVLVFYYSGHAKANAFNLGGEELAVAALRDKLQKLPTTLTLVVLDACQSGQFARVKGAEPAAEFSFNSVSRLTTKGLAIMASSSAQELSQESDQLKSSYFTHHLLVALRGAADSDGDGRVSLDEAYRYAYRRTLMSTSQTKVGGQHVTLETDLAGRGDVPVTYPSEARSQLELPDILEAKVIVQHKPSGNIVAEVQKAPGNKLRLAFVAGSYDAFVRSGAKGFKCKLALADDKPIALDLGRCDETKLVALSGRAKGEDDDFAELVPASEREARDAPVGIAPSSSPAENIAPWSIELGFGFIGRAEDAYTQRLNEFGYHEEEGFLVGRAPHVRAHLGVAKGILPHISVGGYVHTLSGNYFERDAGDSADSFSWDAGGLSAFVRATTSPIGKRTERSAYFDFYGQLGGGATLGKTTLKVASTLGGPINTTTEHHFGYVLGAFAGANFNLPRHFGFFLQGGYEYAPTIANLLGETHNSGGPSGQTGLRFRFD